MQHYKDYEEYAKQRRKTKKVVDDAQATYEKKIMKEFKQKPKQLFNYVRAKQKVKVGISRLEKENGEMTTMDEEAADVLNGFFDSACFHNRTRGRSSRVRSKAQRSNSGRLWIYSWWCSRAAEEVEGW